MYTDILSVHQYGYDFCNMFNLRYFCFNIKTAEMNRLSWEEIVTIHLTRCLPQNSEVYVPNSNSNVTEGTPIHSPHKRELIYMVPNVAYVACILLYRWHKWDVRTISLPAHTIRKLELILSEDVGITSIEY
jgi:hypothetical protein